MTSRDFYSEAEVDEMTQGLTQAAAKIRYLRRVYGLRVDKKPNGDPLAWRPTSTGQADPSVQNQSANATGVVVGLEQWARGKRGQKTQGR